jgi:hypothetical protein
MDSAAATPGPGTPPYTLVWAVRAVPALTAFAALDLLGNDPPTWFLVLTLVRVTLGVLTLVALRLGAREEWCAAFVVVIFLSTLVHPRSSLVLLVFSALALGMTVVDLRRRGRASQEGQTPSAG